MDTRRMTEVTRGLPTISAKIRALDAVGVSRSEIAKFLGKRYQHVRNVLERSKETRPELLSGLEEATVPYKSQQLPERVNVQLGPAGRIVIPAVFRAAMQVGEGDRLMARVVDGELRLITPRMAVRLAQKLVRETIPGDDSLADSLIADRRREAQREMMDG